MNTPVQEDPELLPGLRVRDVMRRDFEMVDGMNTIRDALLMLRYRPAHALVVYRRHDADALGLLLVSDIGRRVLATGRAPERVNIYEVMSKPAITVAVEQDVKACARLLARCAIGLAPVVDAGGDNVGIVSLGDLVINGLLPRLDDPFAARPGTAN